MHTNTIYHFFIISFAQQFSIITFVMLVFKLKTIDEKSKN